MIHRPVPQAALAGFYNKFGSRQDRQSFYEDAALAEIIAHGAFERARSVVEIGCGTGRFAAQLLRDFLPADCRYQGFDIATTMVGLTRERLAPWRDRAGAREADGLTVALEAASHDRFIAAYVVDILSPGEIDTLLDQAHRALAPGGRLCIANLTWGGSLPGRLVSALWARLYRWRPLLVGGCRPLAMAERLDRHRWRLLHRTVVTRFGLSCEVVVAERCAGIPGPVAGRSHVVVKKSV